MVSLADGPLAYFITFHTYGTWLPGDPRGSVAIQHNLAGSLRAGPYQPRLMKSARSLKHAPVVLGEPERAVVVRTIQEVCQHRRWILRAAHVRTNHVHAVIGAEMTPERVMNDLKAWATRRVVEAGLRPQGTRLWVRHGSTRYLWREEAVAAACTYVVEGQGQGREFASWPEPSK